ncbi:MAG TPA: tyrosine--tRNA ligase [Cryomorphaceae bacterium]|nr:MAG: tyrosine--tRNA ligase [Cryomorphaceae bacterium BACL7 MAG-120910-bin2]KRO69246.1 MAG: tyrosine--tRNA ligase [Cryomorphaceae bacterium BACL7 MAG-120322-bin74]KRO81798.1 MAG: tyrosine--tRNA ligase [Cryomorphaceae bacterium BACL7 MAG-121220-bin83]HAG48925.1 tyrosine--tRNA ligase [Cryomorphaceae bacterium]
MSTPFVEELRWRRMLHDSMPGTEELLASGPQKAYIGFDPTADSLGVGNLVQVMMLVHFQRAGHQPYALIGGATGMVGDPSFKSAERQLLDAETLEKNLAGQKAQLMKFLDFDGPNGAKIVNNYDWFKDFGFLDFIRDIGKHITVNYMLAKDSVKSRQESGISFTEFSYQLIQGYDFFHLWKNEGIRLQMGGSDQWGNITTGTELIRRMGAGEAFALTTPLIKKADGTKFGKTEGGNVWLDPNRTSPYQFYQFWLNAADEDGGNYIRIFTTKSREEIESLEAEHAQAPHLRILQKALAADITARVHSEEELQKALQASQILFGQSTAEDLKGLDARTLLDVFEGVPQMEVQKEAIQAGLPILEVLCADTALFASRGEAKKLLAAGGVSLNKSKVDAAYIVTSEDIIGGGYLLAQKGKKNYALIVIK